MIVDCVSDLHGHYPTLEGGDLLIVAGDLTSSDKAYQYVQFFLWLDRQKYTKKIVVAGNHDNVLELVPRIPESLPENISYLCDSGTEFEGLKIWGSPWTKSFPGMNHKCKAFTVDTEEELAEKWELMPCDLDIMITHGPPACILDGVENYLERQIENVGSFRLIHYLTIIQPKLHVFGHIHKGYGIVTSKNLQIIEHLFPNTTFVNASYVNERYEPVNKPIRVVL